MFAVVAVVWSVH